MIGLGGMGSGMARALLASGLAVTAYNRSADRAAPLVEAGAALAPSAAEAVAGAQVVLLSLADENAVDQVLFGELDGRLNAGAVVVDTSTVSPAFAREAAKRLAESGVRRVEACVIGNPEMAAAGRLRVFAAGAESDVDLVRPVLGAIGQEVRFVGGTGSASVLKLALNLMLGVQLLGLAEAVVFAEATGLDRDLLLDAFEGSGWRSPVLSFRAGFMRRREYRPAMFRAALMRKDLDLAHREALEHGADLPMSRCALDRFAAVLAAGRGDDDAAIVAEESW
ncbi:MULTISPECIES: NAD(P)-dependent oxidoreductase [Amycolatopsis]|uniref:NAD(P)-dependent oxidoreductase n=1 Tax=Amycolatopsis TaxID=1813 RepID=UPI001E2C373F|nr:MULTISPECIES: NAD(P)-dependent oxidoreductase [Amycolatopsis]